MNKTPIILGIESSCDDTSAAILSNQKILSNIVSNQEVHSLYGGVVPELASRAHQQNIIPVVDAAIKQANIKDPKQIIMTLFFRHWKSIKVSSQSNRFFTITFSSFYKSNYSSIRVTCFKFNFTSE